MSKLNNLSQLSKIEKYFRYFCLSRGICATLAFFWMISFFIRFMFGPLQLDKYPIAKKLIDISDIFVSFVSKFLSIECNHISPFFFFDVFKGYRNRRLTWIWLINFITQDYTNETFQNIRWLIFRICFRNGGAENKSQAQLIITESGQKRVYRNWISKIFS